VLYALGFKYAFEGEEVTAVHLLIPQLENSIRYILWQNKIISSFQKATDATQVEWDLNTTLKGELGEQLKSILDADIIFDLRGLFVEKFGSNFRNDMAHGLLEYNSLNNAVSIYAWWIIFRICYIFKYHTITEEQNPNTQPAGA
jgi:hypothetical protein